MGATAKVMTAMGDPIWFIGIDLPTLKQLIGDYGKENVTIVDWGPYIEGTDEYRAMKDMLVL